MVQKIPAILITAFALHAALADDIAYFYALDADLAALRKAGQPVESKSAKNSAVIVRIDSHRVYAVKMGSGSMQTAVSAAALFATVSCDLAISTGPAGRLTDGIKIGDWISVSEVVAFQKGSQTTMGFVLSKDAIAQPNGASPPTGSDLTAISKGARVASGDAFIASSAARAELRSLTSADAVDMNLAGLSAACESANVPWIAWKIISDSANETASKDFAAFVESYDGSGGTLIAKWIRQLPPNPDDPKTYPGLEALIDSPRTEPMPSPDG